MAGWLQMKSLFEIDFDENSMSILILLPLTPYLCSHFVMALEQFEATIKSMPLVIWRLSNFILSMNFHSFSCCFLFNLLSFFIIVSHNRAVGIVVALEPHALPIDKSYLIKYICVWSGSVHVRVCVCVAYQKSSIKRDTHQFVLHSKNGYLKYTHISFASLHARMWRFVFVLSHSSKHQR